MNKKSENTAKLLTRQRAAEYVLTKYGLQLSPLSLEKYAMKGTGPTYHKFGSRRVYYYEHDMDAWVKTKLGRPFRSSSDEAWGDDK